MKLRCPKCSEEIDLDSFQKYYDKEELHNIREKILEGELTANAPNEHEEEVNQLKKELETIKAEKRAADVKNSESDLLIGRLDRKSREVTRAASRSNPELKGEAAEIRLEQRISASFPEDNVEPVPKGSPGADVIHHLRTHSGRDVAKLIIESKTGYKSFQSKWVTKLTLDINNHEGNVGILVTDVFPANMKDEPVYQSPQDDRIWVCHPDISLIAIKMLRDGLLKEDKQKIISRHATENTKDLIYKYMTGDFVNQLKLQMKIKLAMESALEKEKAACLSRLKARKVQLESLTSSIVDIVGVVSGIGLPNFELEKIVDPHVD
jgi:hypothetical protein